MNTESVGVPKTPKCSELLDEQRDVEKVELLGDPQRAHTYIIKFDFKDYIIL